MKDKRTGLFSLSVKDGEYFEDKQDSIELVSCPLGGKICDEHRAVINKNLLASRKYLRDKDYSKSIESLKLAYNKTTDLNEKSCDKCAELFRSTVTNSMENIHDDLYRMSRSLFFRKRFQESFVLAQNVLKEFKKEQ